MALPSSGAIRAGADVNVELGNSSTTQISLGQASVRSLYGVASGAIRLAADGYGKSGGFSATISTNQQELNLRTWALANGWNGTSAATITVASNVYIWSSSITIPGLTINGSWPAGITLVNNGFIMGKGGNGGSVSSGGGTTSPQAGGDAISLGVNASITNNSYIGGGGGGGRQGSYSEAAAGGGGGAGGGTGGTGNNDFGAPAAGGAGGTVGNSGANGTNGYSEVGGAYGTYYYYNGGGGGGGRVMPGTGGDGGTGGTTNNNGKGGSAGGGGGGGSSGNNGGAGGSAGNAGTNVTGTSKAGGGGGWGSSGGSSGSGSGGSGGKAIALNGYTATRTGSGSTYGAVS